MEQLEEQLTSCLLTDQEAIVRRAAVDLLAKLAARPELMSSTQLQVGRRDSTHTGISYDLSDKQF
jgi:hypothetical protein